MICELYKLLNNPLKREMFLRIHTSRDGINVSVMADEMQRFGLEMPAVCQYLRQLDRLGVIRRTRAGRYVNYFPDTIRASSDLQRFVEAFVKRFRKGDDHSLDRVFAALMNPFRAKVVAAIAKAGSIAAVEICEKTNHHIRHLKRDLQPAVDAKLIDTDDANGLGYRFIPQPDALVRLMVELCRRIG